MIFLNIGNLKITPKFIALCLFLVLLFPLRDASETYRQRHPKRKQQPTKPPHQVQKRKLL